MREEFGTQLENGSLRFVRILPGPVERVWEYLVDPEKRALWFCGGTMGKKTGDAYVFRFRNGTLSDDKVPEKYANMDGGVETGARVVEIDPPRLLVFSWDDDGEESRFELREHGDQVEFTLIQCPPAKFTDLVGMAAGWHAHLGILVDELAGDTHRGFWTEHLATEAHYQSALRL
jgi:uncharacterized protein YndB with AHSA1/START domain